MLYKNYLFLAFKLLEMTYKSPTSKKHAAAIVKNSRLLYKRSNFQGMHAEENVLRFLNKNGIYKEKIIIVIRCENNILKYSKPCKYCIELLKKNNIKKVVYTTGDNDNPIAIENVNNIENNWTTPLSRRKHLNKCFHR
jgi:deoxycytidylate deaminase